MAEVVPSMDAKTKEQQELRDLLKLVIGEHSTSYAVYRVEEIIREHERKAVEYGYAVGWNACIDEKPKKMRVAKVVPLSEQKEVA